MTEKEKSRKHNYGREEKKYNTAEKKVSADNDKRQKMQLFFWPA